MRVRALASPLHHSGAHRGGSRRGSVPDPPWASHDARRPSRSDWPSRRSGHRSRTYRPRGRGARFIASSRQCSSRRRTSSRRSNSAWSRSATTSRATSSSPTLHSGWERLTTAGRRADALRPGSTLTAGREGTSLQLDIRPCASTGDVLATMAARRLHEEQPCPSPARCAPWRRPNSRPLSAPPSQPRQRRRR